MKIKAIVLATIISLANISHAQESKPSSLSGTAPSGLVVKLDLSSMEACRAGQNSGVIYGVLKGKVISYWPKQKCSISHDGSNTRLSCSSEDGVWSPMSNATFEQSMEPEKSAACSYTCISGCDKHTPTTLQQVAPIVFDVESPSSTRESGH